MAKQYRDYGNLVGQDQYTIPVIRQQIDYERKGDVYRLTHDGEGKSLSFIDKAFISFTYGGKKIEDFGLIAVSVDDRYNGESPPQHEDFVTDARMLNGQYYWGSHYNAREMTISLATDGMTQMQLDKFKYWFQAGEMRELIMAQHPNRGIIARIAQAPQISIVPFPRKKRTIINDQEIEVTIIQYKGNIQLNLVMDDPFWYAINNVLGIVKRNEDGQIIIADQWVNANGEVIQQLDKDALKVAVEDHIPTSSMIQSKTFFPDNLQLNTYGSYKYTLTGQAIEQPSDLQGLVGTPLVTTTMTVGNAVIESSLYPLSGAVVGPLYEMPYDDDQIINTIKNNWIIPNVQLNANGDIDEVRQEIQGQNRYFVMQKYLPVKSGTISYTKNIGNLKIILYTKENNTYILDKTIIINSNNKSYVFQNQRYVRLELQLPNSSVSQDGIINFNNFISISLLTFKTFITGTLLTKEDSLNYFYSGTAPSHPSVNFSVPLTFDQNGYINTFSNVYSQHENEKNYNSMSLQSEFEHKLSISNPSIFNSYNKVIKKLHTNTEENIVELIQWFRNQIGHVAVRNWIIGCINIYYNNNLNLDNKDNNIIIGSLGKQYLLACMPYLFASSSQADITIKEQTDIPTMIRLGDRELGNISFNTNYPRLPVFKDNNTNVIIINCYEDKPLTITATVENNNALFYEWQYSYDKVQWYQMDGNWYDDITNTLKCDHFLSENNNMYLRCIISNNVYTVGNEEKDILQLIIISDSLTIERNKSKYTLSQNTNYTSKSNTKIFWKIQGRYLDQKQGDIDYSPRLYYQKPETADWIWWDNRSAEDDADFYNQIISPTLSIDKTNNNIYLYLKVSENQAKELRGTKFLVRLYKISAQESLQDSDYYVESNAIQIDITRLQIDQAQVKMWAILENETTTRQVNNFNSTLEFYPNTKLIIEVSNITNLRKPNNTTRTNYIQFLLSTSDSETGWVQLNSQMAYQASPQVLSYTLSFNEITSGVQSNLRFKLRICVTDYGESFFLPKNSQIQIHCIDVDTANSTIEQFINNKKYISAQYVGQTNIRIISGDTFTVECTENNTLPVTALSYKVTYQWHYNNTLTNGQFIINEGNKIYDPVIVYKHDISWLEKKNCAVTSTGYYKCHVTLEIQNPSRPGTYLDAIDISPTSYCTISIINPIILDDLITNMDDWYYYSDEDHPYSNADNEMVQDVTKLIIQCPITNYTNECQITALRIKNKVSTNYSFGSHNDNGYQLSIEVDEHEQTFIKLQLSYEQETDIFTYNQGADFSFKIIDAHGRPYDSQTKKFSLNNSKSKREQPITDYTTTDNYTSWRLPQFLFRDGRCLATTVTKINGILQPLRELCELRCDYKWNNNQLVISGIPLSNTAPSNDDIFQRNTAAATQDIKGWKGTTNAGKEYTISTEASYPSLTFKLFGDRQLDSYINFKSGDLNVRSPSVHLSKYYYGYGATYKTVLQLDYDIIQQFNIINILFDQISIFNYENQQINSTNSLYNYSIRIIQKNNNNEDIVLAESAYADNSLEFNIELDKNIHQPLIVQALVYRPSHSTKGAWQGINFIIDNYKDDPGNKGIQHEMIYYEGIYSGVYLQQAFINENTFNYQQYDPWKQTMQMSVNIIGMY